MKQDFSQENTQGWGVITDEGSEIWDAKPMFIEHSVRLRDFAKLVFFPKKFFLYRHILKAKRAVSKKRNLHIEPFRVLDIGCGTGGAVIDLKRLLGREAEVVGLDVVRLQIDLARRQIKEHGIHADIAWYDGRQFPFSSQTFDAVYTSDVLGHVENVPRWLDEIYRVLKPDGALAMFAESELGKHAYLRNFFMKHGLNTDPHAAFHISLYSKHELQRLLRDAGFDIQAMYGSVWAKFLVHPDELRPAFKRHRSLILLPFKLANGILYVIKKKTHPFSTAACELYSFFEMCVLGKWVESQGYVILGKRR